MQVQNCGTYSFNITKNAERKFSAHLEQGVFARLICSTLIENNFSEGRRFSLSDNNGAPSTMNDKQKTANG